MEEDYCEECEDSHENCSCECDPEPEERDFEYDLEKAENDYEQQFYGDW